MAISAKARLVFRIGLCRTSKVYGKPPRCDHGSLSTESQEILDLLEVLWTLPF